MASTFEKFNALHQSTELFVLPNVWDARSAQLFQQQNIRAIATSSSAVAASLGYEDGEGMPFSDYLFVINRIVSSVQLPLSVDFEMGYGTSDKEIVKNIVQLIEMGVAGINIEDSQIGKAGRTLKDAQTFAASIGQIRGKLAGMNSNLFINVRCDTFLLNVKDLMEETRRRIKIYAAAGADGIFLPCIAAEQDIRDVVSYTKLPLNVMCVPGLPDFELLRRLGVRRVSMGPFLFNKVYDSISRLSRAIVASQDFSPLFL